MIKTPHRLVGLVLAALAACGAPTSPSSSPTGSDAAVGSGAHRRFGYGAPSAGPTTGWITSITASAPLTGGTITTSGTIGLALAANLRNNGGNLDLATAVVAPGTLQTVGALTVQAGGLAVTAGGLSVSAGGGAITGNVAVTSGNVQVATAGQAVQLVQASGTAVAPYIQAFAGDPNGTVSSTHAGDVIVDTVTPALWHATAASSTVWRRDAVYLGRQVLTAASGTYTPDPRTRGAIVRMCGAGGGGAGSATSAATTASAGAGGGAGAYIEFRIGFAGTAIGTATYTTGTAGTAGSAGANAGGTGGDSTFVFNSGTYTAKGATGGAASAATSAELVNGGKPQAGTGCSGTCVTIDVTNGTAGGYAWYGGSANFSNPVSGAGGSGPFGAGGAAVTGSSTAGAAGVGNCSGGGGASTGNSGTQQAGGAGTAGIILVDEFD